MVLSCSLALALSCFFIINGAGAATVYEMGSNRTKKLYFHKKMEKTNGDTLVSVIEHFDLSNKKVISETLKVKGNSVASYAIEQSQIDESGKMEVKDGVIYFSYKKNGKVKTDEERVKGILVAGPMIGAFIKSHWKELMGKKTVKIRLAVLDRLETVGFRFRFVETKDYHGQQAVKIKMSASSFFIRALVDPILFYFKPDGSKLLSFVGRTQLKKKVNDRWKPLDAETVF